MLNYEQFFRQISFTFIDKTFYRKTFQKALRIWSKHSSLRFRYSRENPDIQILFARLDHGDGAYNAFDGQGTETIMLKI